MKRTRSQSLVLGQIRPEETRGYDPGDDQSDYHSDEQLKERERFLPFHDFPFGLWAAYSKENSL